MRSYQEIDLRGKVALTTGQNLLIVFLANGRAVALSYPLVRDGHDMSAETPLPVHNANAGVVIIL